MKVCLTAVLFSLAQIAFGTGAPPPAPANPVYGDSLLRSIPDANEMLFEIMKIVGLQANFELREAKVDNIEASISRRKRYILYNPAYINWINHITKDKWAAMALLAHEVGHHLNGHTIRRSGSKPKLELEADEFAGFILQKLGASLEQSQEVMVYIAAAKASRTHPARAARMQAIQRGWARAAGSNSAAMASKN